MKLSDLGYNQFEIICRNRTCKWHNVTRTVSLPIVTAGAYQVGDIRCECQKTPEFVEKQV